MTNGSKVRGFEAVKKEHLKYGTVVGAHGSIQTIYPETQIPQRADVRSAGYDFYTPVDVVVLPGKTETIWTNVKAYMQENEVLQLHVRSSIGIKQGVTLANITGIVDASYYENESNDGNIGLVLRNNTGRAVEFKAGERIAQGLFMPYLVADTDMPIHEKRTGGTGSSGK